MAERTSLEVELALAVERLADDLEHSNKRVATLIEAIALATGMPLSTEPSDLNVDIAVRAIRPRGGRYA